MEGRNVSWKCFCKFVGTRKQREPIFIFRSTLQGKELRSPSPRRRSELDYILFRSRKMLRKQLRKIIFTPLEI